MHVKNSVQPFRILHVIGSLEMGGSQSMVLNLYRVIDRSKVQFDFIIDHPDDTTLAPAVEELGAKIYTMPTFKGTNIFEIKKAWNCFFLEHTEYKILHSHVRSYASVYIPVAKKHGLKTIIHSHSTSNGKGITALIKKALQYPLRYQADFFFSCSKDAGEWLFGKKTVLHDNHYILANAIDVMQYRFDSETRKEYREFLEAGDKRVYIHVGRFCVPKNHSFLLDVFRELHSRTPDSMLILVGDGELRGEIEEKIKELGLNEAVKLVGNRSDVAKILQAADCFLFPSLYEGLGIVAIEAQAAGLKCICSDRVPKSAGITERCVFLPLGDVEKWAEEAENIPNLRCDTSVLIKAEGYDINSTAKWLEDFYTDITKKDEKIES